MVDELACSEHVQLQRAGKRRHATSEPVMRLAGLLIPISLPDIILYLASVTR